MIVFVRSDASAEQITLIDSVLRASPTIIDVSKLKYLNKTESYEEAKRIFVGDPVTLSLLTPESIPTQFKVVPLSDDPTLVRSLSDQYRTLPGVDLNSFKFHSRCDTRYVAGSFSRSGWFDLEHDSNCDVCSPSRN
jgi:cell division protein FtsX